MKGKIYLITTIILFISLTAAGYFLFDFYSQIEDLTTKNEDLKNNLDSTQEELEAAQNEAISLEEELGLAENQIILLEEENAAQADEITSLFAEVMNLTHDFEKLTDSYIYLQSLAFCDAEYTKDLEISYESNESVSEALRAWHESQFPKLKISEVYWDKIWVDMDIAIHSIFSYDSERDYGDLFLVYFEAVRYSHRNGVFWFGGQCWLDLETRPLYSTEEALLVP